MNRFRLKIILTISLFLALSLSVAADVYFVPYMGDIDGGIDSQWFFFYQKVLDWHENNSIPVGLSFYPATMNNQQFNQIIGRMYASRYVELILKGEDTYNGKRIDQMNYADARVAELAWNNKFVTELQSLGYINVKYPVTYNQLLGRFTITIRNVMHDLGYKIYLEQYVSEYGNIALLPDFDITQYSVSLTTNGQAGPNNAFKQPAQIIQEILNFQDDHLIYINGIKVVPLLCHQQDFRTSENSATLNQQKWDIYTTVLQMAKNDSRIHLLKAEQVYDLRHNISINLTNSSICGDGINEIGESCDNGVANTNNPNLGCYGQLSYCNTTCSSKTANCSNFCDDGIINNGEECEGLDLGGKNCSSLGFPFGTLSCKSCLFDKGNCSLSNSLNTSNSSNISGNYYFIDFETNQNWIASGNSQGKFSIGEPKAFTTTTGQCQSTCIGTGVASDHSANGTKAACTNLVGYLGKLETYLTNNLTSTIYDFSGKTNINLTLWRFMEIEGNNFDFCYYQYKNNSNGLWINLETYGATAIDDSTWVKYSKNISNIASGKTYFQLRFYCTTDDWTEGSGLCLDDINISWENTIPPVPPVCGNNIHESGEECDTNNSQTIQCGITNVGECEFGIQTRNCSIICQWNAFDTCTGNIDPISEICDDGKDNDCDGFTDINDSNCQICGNNVCENNETCNSCPSDCNVCPINKSLILRPNGQGFRTSWSNTGCGSGNSEWQCVDEDPANTNDYLSDTGTSRETFTFSDTESSIPNTSKFTSLTLFYYGRTQSSQSNACFESMIRSAGKEYGSGIQLCFNSTFKHLSQKYLINPATNLSWTKSSIDALEAGMHSIDPNGGGRISQVYASIEYS